MECGYEVVNRKAKISVSGFLETPKRDNSPAIIMGRPRVLSKG